jgi:hypothetical protein
MTTHQSGAWNFRIRIRQCPIPFIKGITTNQQLSNNCHIFRREFSGGLRTRWQKRVTIFDASEYGWPDSSSLKIRRNTPRNIVYVFPHTANIGLTPYGM